MKKLFVLALALVLALSVIGCASQPAETPAEEPAAETPAETAEAPAQEEAQEEAPAELVTIKVGASITPHAEILNAVKDDLAAQGYNLEVVEFTDYVLPNTALEEGDLDANYFQHGPYLDDFNAQNGTHLVAVAAIHYEPFGIYAGKTTSLEELADGATVAIPNDGTNEARALLLLEAQGLIKVTIPEGYTVREIIDLLAEKGVATKEDLEDACANFAYEDYDFLDDDKLGSIDRMEGFLFPSTYEFDKNRSAVYTVETMLVYFKNSISQQMLADIKASPYSLQEIITMASLIEKESIGDDTERKNISSVIHNRLENPSSEKGGRALQLCSTINYIMKHDGVKTFDTEIDSPYNTYINPGLTPGPICNPGLSAIEAAIYPADTDYYFFALGKDGKSHFFTDYNEHLKFINSGEYQPIYS